MTPRSNRRPYPKSSPLPHIPATCPHCYALADPVSQRIADVVRGLLANAGPDVHWHQPAGTPLCLRRNAPNSLQGQAVP